MRTFLAMVAVMMANVALCASAHETLDQLKARAEAAKADQGKLFAEVAAQEVEVASQLFTAGNAEQGQATVKEAAEYAEKARDACARTHKKVKETEIIVRKTARRLDDLRRTLAFDDRAPVQEAVTRMEKARTDLLNLMFHHKEKKP